MQKTRLYLDTSVISMIDAPYAPEKEKMTKEFFRIISERNDEYEIYISPIGLTEIDEAPFEKKTIFLAMLRSLNYVNIPKSKTVNGITEKYLQAGFLTKNHIDDLTHIAYAVFAQCDYVVSWNMKHMVREKTISGVRAVNVYNNYCVPFIVTPEVFIQENIS